MAFKRRLEVSNNFNENSQAENNKSNIYDATCLKKILAKSSDVKFQRVFINNDKDEQNLHATLIFIDGMVNITYISDYILKPLTEEQRFRTAKNIEDVISLIENGAVYFPSRSKATNMNQAINGILAGQAVLLFEQCNNEGAIIFDVKEFEKRAVAESSSENITKGAKDSFVETLNVNTVLVRRKIKTKQLIIEKLTVGSETQTDIAVLYIEGLADSSLVKNIKEKLINADISSVNSVGVIEEAISNNCNSAFPQIMDTERTDKFCSDILEGRVGILIDGFPIGYVLPTLFIQFLQAPEDYSHNFIVSSLIRTMRYFLMLLTLFLPGVYVALISFNPEMIPTNLALAIAQYRIGVTFPTFIETIFMLIAFEILIEAGNRMPKNIGQAVSIVGALIVGDAAVNAKVVSPSVVIVVALTAIAGFSMPNLGLGNALRLWRFIITIAASILGLVGLVFSFIALIVILVSLENFGVPFMVPFVSTDGEDMGDTLFRPFHASSKTKSQQHKSLKRS